MCARKVSACSLSVKGPIPSSTKYLFHDEGWANSPAGVFRVEVAVEFKVGVIEAEVDEGANRLCSEVDGKEA